MNNFRRGYLMVAELMDVFRVIPRALVAGYAFLVYKVVDWYMNLEPYFPQDVVPMLGELAKSSADIQLLLVDAPTNQHAALVTAVVGFATGVFGLYASTGIKWGDYEFKMWPFKKKDKSDDSNDSA